MEQLDLPIQVPSDEGCDDESIIFDICGPEFCTDEFRMYNFKVQRCPKQRPHDWTQCPFAHCGERATRRDPRLFIYSGSACAEFRRTGTCSRGDHCSYAHGVFECWLHPSKYKTQMCSDITCCKRPVCFFAHSVDELRSPPGPGAPKNGMPCKPLQRSASDFAGMKSTGAAMNVEAIAAEVEKLLGQKAASASAPMAGMYGSGPANATPNPLSSFLQSVLQLQHSMPGVNVMQLLHAVTGSPEQRWQGNFLPPKPAPNAPSGDLASALMQAQAQAHAQAHANTEFMRQTSWGGHSAPAMTQTSDSGPLSGPLGSFDSTFSPRSGGLSSLSAPFAPSGHSNPHRDSGSLSRGPSSMSAPQPIPPTTKPSSLTFQQTAKGSSIDWSHSKPVPMDCNVNRRVRQESASGVSDMSATSVDNRQNVLHDYGMWGRRESMWSATAQAYSVDYDTEAPGMPCLADDCCESKHMDPLLDALPRDLSDIKLTDVTNNLLA